MSIITLLISFFVFFASADDRFNNTKIDFNVPAHCEEVTLDNFDGSADGIERFFYGRAGAVAMGFTFEYPLKRSAATTLWNYFQSVVKGTPSLDLYSEIQKDPDLYRDYKLIMANYAGMGVDFSNEGDVLEVLAVVDIRRRYPAPMYYITGGIEYREAQGARTLGELDVVVSRSRDCSVVMIGEVKLGGGKMLNKAQEQLERFSSFLKDHGQVGLAGETMTGVGQTCPQVKEISR